MIRYIRAIRNDIKYFMKKNNKIIFEELASNHLKPEQVDGYVKKICRSNRK